MIPFPKGLLAGFTAAALTCLFGCSPLCGDTSGGQARSPDNMLDAITTYRDCGATTPEYTRVTLQPAPGNHYDINQIVFTTRNHHEVGLLWKGASELTIKCPTCQPRDIELQIVKFRSVVITYEPGPAGAVGPGLTGGNTVSGGGCAMKTLGVLPAIS